MSVNVSTVFNVVILVFIGFEILNSAFDAKTRVSQIRLPKSFLLSDRESYENYESTLNTLADLPAVESQEEEDLSLTIAYSEYTNPHKQVSDGPADPNEVSYYLEWIRKDLEPWAKTGITEELIDAGAHNWSCAGERMRFNIIDGALWVEHLSWRPREGWYPAKLGPGNMSAKGKIPYVIFALLDTLRAYPGQIPDVEVAIHTADFPCIHSNDDGRPPPIVMASNSGYKFADVVFPDYSYYGHEHSWLWSPDNTYMMGWEAQYELNAQKWANYTLMQRVPQVMWRGRTFDPENPDRDAMRRDFVECPAKLAESGHQDDARLYNVDGGSYMLTDVGDFRYNMYLESEAWVTNLRLKLSCGSVMLSNRMEYYEFFTRALVPGYHYVEVDQDHMCDQSLGKIKAMDARLFEHRDSLPMGANFPVASAWDWHKFSYSPLFMEHLVNGTVNGQRAAGAAGRKLLTERMYKLKRRRRDDGQEEDVPEEGQTAEMPATDPSAAAAEIPPQQPEDQAAVQAATVEAQQQAAAAGQAQADAVEAQAQQQAAEAQAQAAAAQAAAAQAAAAQVAAEPQAMMQQPVAASEPQAVAAGRAGGLDPALDPDADEPAAGAATADSLVAGPIMTEVQRAQLLETLPSHHGEASSSSSEAAAAQQPAEETPSSKPAERLKPHASGLEPRRLEGGRTPMQQRDHLAGLKEEHVWGKVEPWVVPENSGKFVRDHVRMTDVRLYIRDLLREYAALQTFKPTKHTNSVCYTGKLLLEQFGNPHVRDAHILRQSYPWLQAFNPGCPDLPQPPAPGSAADLT